MVHFAEPLKRMSWPSVSMKSFYHFDFFLVQVKTIFVWTLEVVLIEEIAILAKLLCKLITHVDPNIVLVYLLLLSGPSPASSSVKLRGVCTGRSDALVLLFDMSV